jgi:ribosomal protein S27E
MEPHERKALWEKRGFQVANDPYLRCPYCSAILAEGRYPDSSIRIKCRRCGNLVSFQRLPP